MAHKLHCAAMIICELKSILHKLMWAWRSMIPSALTPRKREVPKCRRSISEPWRQTLPSSYGSSLGAFAPTVQNLHLNCIAA
ncbi:hypothetical protein Pst134EB_001696 [Puccinia striiformis f. sp. tritici]|nr:hypothetical protein Pst134EB_001696 [Puccinia striiformis f. sp. tritici]